MALLCLTLLAYPPARADAGAAAPTGPTTGSRLVFTGDFETGDFSQWSKCQNRSYSGDCRSYDGTFYGAQIVHTGARQGRFAAHFEVRDGDVPHWGGGERSEISRYRKAMVTEGAERWYQFSLKFAGSFPAVAGRPVIVMQWHSGLDRPPPLALEVDAADRLILADHTGPDMPDPVIGKIVRGRWVDYVVHVKFSKSARTGWAEVYQDGERVLPRHARATMISNSNYLKIGIYRSNAERSRAVMWQDGLRITAP